MDRITRDVRVGGKEFTSPLSQDVRITFFVEIPPTRGIAPQDFFLTTEQAESLYANLGAVLQDNALAQTPNDLLVETLEA